MVSDLLAYPHYLEVVPGRCYYVTLSSRLDRTFRVEAIDAPPGVRVRAANGSQALTHHRLRIVFHGDAQRLDGQSIHVYAGQRERDVRVELHAAGE